MGKPVRKTAEFISTVGNTVAAACYLAIGLTYLLFGLWLSLSFENWFVIGIGLLVGLQGAALIVRASEIYRTAHPAERPDERQRYLESRALYIPTDRKQARAQGRRERDGR